MGYYRKKPVVIEAVQWTGDEHQLEDPDWICKAIADGNVVFDSAGSEDVKLVVRTLEGDMVADRGDWIIRGVAGEIYPCKPEIFAASYEDVE